MTVVATLSGVLRLDDSNFRSGMQNARQETNSFGQRLRTAGENVRDFGVRATVATAPIAAYLTNAVRATQQFDRNMSNINAILGSTNEEASALRTELLAYGSGTVAGPMAVSEAFYAIVSGVADATTHMAILDAATRTSEAGQADLMATTSGLISVMNSYGFAADDAAYVSDVFTRTVQTGVLTMDELAASFPQVTGLAAQFNIGLDELGSGLAFLTTQGFAASQSATFMRSMLTTLLNPTADLSEAITALGYDSGAALLEAEGLVGAYTLLAEQNGGLDGLITNSEALQGALALTNDEAAGFFETYNSGIEGATDAAGLIQDQTEQWLLLKSQMQGLSILIGSALMPVLMDLVQNYITPTVTAVSAWIAENPELTRQIVTMTAGLLVLFPIIGMVGAAIGLLLSPVGILVAGFGAIIAVLEKTQEGGVIGSVGRMITTINQARTLAIIGLHTAIQNLIGLFNQFLTIVERTTGAVTTFTNAAGVVQDIVQGNTLGTSSNAVGMTDLSMGAEQIALGATSGNPFQMINGLGAMGINPPGSGIVRAVSSFFGPRRAGGGSANAGIPTMVGEVEPEAFVPSMPGEIYNQNQMRQMGGGIQISNITINANDYEGGRAAGRGFMDEINELSRGRGIRAVGA